jgi:hypothetical protein
LCQAPNPVEAFVAPNASTAFLTFHFQQQNRHIHFVAHFVDSRPIKYVANETMAVRSHCNQIDVFFPRQFDNFVRGFAQRQNSVTGKALAS